MEEKIPRLLRANEISARVQSVYEHGVLLLLFTNSRCVQKILDETYGVMGWQRFHTEVAGQNYCSIMVWNSERDCWITKQDVGTQSYSEKEKGEASDSFKRAAVNWGIARELYTTPFLWIPSSKVDIERKGDRLVTNERFHVDAIEYDEERNISYLKIMNASNQVVYVWGKRKEKALEDTAIQMVTDEQMELLRKELQRTGVSIEAVLGRYCIGSEQQISDEVYRKAMNDLKRTKTLRRAA